VIDYDATVEASDHEMHNQFAGGSSSVIDLTGSLIKMQS